MPFPLTDRTPREASRAVSLMLCVLPLSCQATNQEPAVEPREPQAAPLRVETPPDSGKPILSAAEAVTLARKYAGSFAPALRHQTLMNMGVTLAERGDFPEAETLFRDALDAGRLLDKDGDSKLALTLVNLNGTLIRQSKFPELLEVSQRAFRESGPTSLLRSISLIGFSRALEHDGRLGAALVLCFCARAQVTDGEYLGKSASARAVVAEHERATQLLTNAKGRAANWPELRATLEALEPGAPKIVRDTLLQLLIQTVVRPKTANARGLIASELSRRESESTNDRGESFALLADALTGAFYATRGRESDLPAHIRNLILVGDGHLREASTPAEERRLHLALYRLNLAHGERLTAAHHLAWIADSDAMQGFSVDGYRDMLEKLRSEQPIPPPAPVSAGETTKK